MSEVRVFVGGVPDGGSREERALARFREAHASGVRRWKHRLDGEEFEIVEVLNDGVPRVRIRLDDGREFGYTMRSSANWEPMAVA